ncbi:hypothetical protein GCM10027275_24450 [Rhabdobacter roseus]|uniref:Outer membrane protein beta-barrel domain-containing protein n=1 Tax=Rhabdobacter roseus TaxID=1655419 RepID=A0A840TN74_9BACT|nr:outer membrane beta-barrel protein [Rhabdobacter roseus]MBB5284385.1 hypothetical protein [Rhabdobacter roseus]
MKKSIATVIVLFIVQVVSLAQDADSTRTTYSRTADSRKVYFTNGGNGGILSFASVKQNGDNVRSIPRYTLFFNIGTNAHYDASEHFGTFVGLNLTNIGMITRQGSVKLKQRVYTLGVPVGIKVGNLNGFYVYAGAEAALPINYKEKLFIDNKKQDKFNEWFSDRSSKFMPALFLGFQTKENFTIKFQYYVTDFLNADFETNGVKPYDGIESKIFFVTLGYSITRK